MASVTLAITLYSNAYPHHLHFGNTQLNLHESVSIGGSISLTPSLLFNLFMAYMGTTIVMSAFDWFRKGQKD